MMWITIIVLFYLVILGIADLRKRRIPVVLLGIGGVLLPGIGIYRGLQEELGCTEMVIGMLPGVFLVLVAWLTRKAGYADGVVLMQMGLCMGYREVLPLFCFSMLLLSVVSVILLFLRKVKKETKMPYLTFLAFTFLAWSIWGG